jgi:hypothetical protein
MLDLESIAQKTGLITEDKLSWSDDEIPLHKRGVSVSWLIDFVHEVDRAWQDVVKQHESDQLASIRYDGPWPAPLPFSADLGMTAEFLVPNVIRPMTLARGAPLFALVPEQYRAEPDLFVSHAWNNPLARGAGPFCTLYSLHSPLSASGPREFVWIDFACYNQHRVECVADDMKAVISSIGRVGIPMINSVPFTRLWCLWEILCAHLGDAPLEFYEANGSAYDLGFLANRFREEFKSVECAATTLPEDREQILEAMISTFGSIARADEYVLQLVDTKLSKDSDKPWNRP